MEVIKRLYVEDTKDVKKTLEQYVKNLQNFSDERFKKEYNNVYEMNMHPRFAYREGGKFYKIIEGQGEAFLKTLRGSVFAFVDKVTGDIYKPAGYNAPAKGIRGNIFDDKVPLTARELYRR